MKTAEQQEDDLLVNIGRLSYCANQNDWKRFEMLLRAFTNQIQSDAIESTVRKCADVASKVIPTEGGTLTKHNIVEAILSLIPQKEKKV